jgi:20S proteasome subunit alpha 3
MDSTCLTAELAEVIQQPGTGEVQYELCSLHAMDKLLDKAWLAQPAPEA